MMGRTYDTNATHTCTAAAAAKLANQLLAGLSRGTVSWRVHADPLARSPLTDIDAVRSKP